VTAPAQDPPAVLTVEELVAAFDGRRKRSAIYADIARGAIPSLRLGRRLYVPGWYLTQLREGGAPRP
jgi:hypothetical protein